MAVLIGMLAASAQRLWIGAWTGAVVKRIVFVVTAISIAVIVPLTVAAIWGSYSAGSGRALGAFSFLALIGFVLTPARHAAAPDNEKPSPPWYRARVRACRPRGSAEPPR